MDVKVQVINNVLSSLKDFDQSTLDKIENILYINFEKYEIKEKCTEVVVHDGSNLGLIKKFIATKKLEGKIVKMRFIKPLKNKRFMRVKKILQSITIIYIYIVRNRSIFFVAFSP